MKKLVLLLLLAIIFLPKTAQAKILPQAKVSGKAPVVKSSKAATVNVSAKLRADRKALIVNFSGLENASAVSYLLTYRTNTQEEGAMGSLNLRGSSKDRAELLFGTCSKNVCRYHSGVNNARLEVSYTLKTNKKYLKKFRIKV